MKITLTATKIARAKSELESIRAFYRRNKLLSTNSKTEKLNGIEYLIIGLSIAPHGKGGLGNVCADATPGCIKACVLWYTGRTVMPNTRKAMERRKALFFLDRELFLAILRKEIRSHIRKAQKLGLIPAVRLNVASDIDWREIAAEFPDCVFYDYTKVRSRMLESRSDNYHLTYSHNERSAADFERSVLESGQNVAIVFDTPYNPQNGVYGILPKTWKIDGKRFRVVDGDRIDVRVPAIDGKGVIVGLRFKGSRARKLEAVKSGFCVAVKS